jgi:hypothetical protein
MTTNCIYTVADRVPGVLRRVTQPINASMVVILADVLVFVVKVENRVKDVEICTSSAWKRWSQLCLLHHRSFPLRPQSHREPTVPIEQNSPVRIAGETIKRRGTRSICIIVSDLNLLYTVRRSASVCALCGSFRRMYSRRTWPKAGKIAMRSLQT